MTAAGSWACSTVRSTRYNSRVNTKRRISQIGLHHDFCSVDCGRKDERHRIRTPGNRSWGEAELPRSMPAHIQGHVRCRRRCFKAHPPVRRFQMCALDTPYSPVYKSYPSTRRTPTFCLDFLVSGHIKITVISYPCTRHTPTFGTQFLDKKARLIHGWIRYLP